MELTLQNLLPHIVPDIDWKIHTFQGKHHLLKHIGNRLRGYSSWIAAAHGAVVVVVDRDDDDCRELKATMELAAAAAGLLTPAKAGEGQVRVLNRIAVEELEAWFFGDVPALAAAFPGVPTSLGSRQRYRAPDSIAGGTWEALERVLQRDGHRPGRLAKGRAAEAISSLMNVESNTSPSFQQFRDGVRRIVRPEGEAA